MTTKITTRFCHVMEIEEYAPFFHESRMAQCLKYVLLPYIN